MYQYARAWRAHWRTIEVKRAVELCVRRKLWVDARSVQQIQGCESLGQKAIPQSLRKLGIGTAKDGDEMVFESANRTFCSIAPMHSSGCELKKIQSFVQPVLLESSGRFVVKLLEFGLLATRC